MFLSPGALRSGRVGEAELAMVIALLAVCTSLTITRASVAPMSCASEVVGPDFRSNLTK